MSVMGEGSKRVYSASLSQGSLSSMTLAKPVGMGEPEKIRLNLVVSFGANRCVSSQLYSLCPFWSLKSSIFTCKAISFNMMASIFRFIVSVSLLTRLAFNSPDTDHQIVRSKSCAWTVFRLTPMLPTLCSLLPTPWAGKSTGIGKRWANSFVCLSAYILYRWMLLRFRLKTHKYLVYIKRSVITDKAIVIT